MQPDLENKPYLIDAVIGNSRFLASMLRTGRMVRMWWPHIDFPQHADRIRAGIRLDGEGNRTSWFDGREGGWNHQAGYLPGTNVFEVSAASPGIPIEVRSSYFAVPGEDFLVFYHRFVNKGDVPVSFSFVWYSSLLIEENPHYQTTLFHHESDALVHYRKDYYFLASGANVCAKFQACDAWDNAESGRLNGNEIQMRSDGAMEWRIEGLAPGAESVQTVYLAAGQNLESGLAALGVAKSKPVDEWLRITAEEDRRFIQSAAECPLDDPEVRELYERSVLTLKLMSDERSGSIVAAPEFDERFTRCGGYAYCWGRDAAFITTALDKAGLHRLSDAFYAWSLTAQDQDGSWQQRHYHDGSLAPSWGLQIDEGASILWGMLQHYHALPPERKDAFLAMIRESAYRGAEFLIRSIDEENGLPASSRDLWEERDGQHTYSSAAVYGGLQAAASIAGLSGDSDLAERFRKAASRVGDSIRRLCWSEDAGRFLRGVNLKVDVQRGEEAKQQGAGVTCTVSPKGYAQYRLHVDPVIDTSLLGVSVPFAVVPPEDPKAVGTADAIEQALTVPGVGGLLRYEGDTYNGGNPWILTTLWLAQYRASIGQPDRALELLRWAVRHQTDCGLLPEQVDRLTGETSWVVPLTWSHAMFILAVHEISEAKTAK